MKFFKSNLKLIIGFMVGIILASGITVWAATKYFASEIKYTDSQSVEQALNDLYSKSTEYKKLDTNTTATPDKIINNYTAYKSDGTLITGTYTPVTTTKSIEWNSGTIESITNGNFEIPVGFVPSKTFIFFSFKNVNNYNGQRLDQIDENGKMYTSGYCNDPTWNAWSWSGNSPIGYTFSNNKWIVTFNDVNYKGTVYWYAVK